MPDQGLAPWVSANDKPAVGAGSKPTSGDAAEMRLKGEVMQLLSRDRRRIKDLQQNEVRATIYNLYMCDLKMYRELISLYRLTRIPPLPTSSQNTTTKRNVQGLRKIVGQVVA